MLQRERFKRIKHRQLVSEQVDSSNRRLFVAVRLQIWEKLYKYFEEVHGDCIYTPIHVSNVIPPVLSCYDFSHCWAFLRKDQEIHGLSMFELVLSKRVATLCPWGCLVGTLQLWTSEHARAAARAVNRAVTGQTETQTFMVLNSSCWCFKNPAFTSWYG